MLPPDVLPTDNEWGVPVLDIALQPASVTPPVLPWGSRARGAANTGTWSFYVDDYRFGSVRQNIDAVVRTKCTACTEINITLHDGAPRAVALASAYEKRRVAALLQARGIAVFVDICVPSEHFALNFLGVPRGWRAFATRGYADLPDELRKQHAAATEWAGRMPLLLVIGGGAPTQQLCRELPGAVWYPGHDGTRSR